VRFVLDASVTMAWCFEDERTDLTEGVLDSLAEGGEAVVPPIWAYEVANVLVGAQQRGRLTAARVASFMEDLQDFAIQTDPQVEGRVLGPVAALARERRLTVYDAAYLELAMRSGLPIATLDERLQHAAGEVGVRLIGS